MNNLGILFRYEWKKIWKRKIVWIMGSIVIIIMLWVDLSFLIPYYTDSIDSAGNSYSVQQGGYEAYVKESENARKLDGRKLDEQLLREVWEDYENEEYEEIQALLGSLDVLNWRKSNVEVSAPADTDQEDDVVAEGVKSWYQELQWIAEEKINSAVGLTSAERQYWLAQDAKVEKPLTYTYAKSWEHILAYIQDANIWLVLLCAVCLSGVFSEERRKKTDSLILSTKNGKNPVFFAKILAGIAFAVLWFLILHGINFFISFLFYGVEGFSAQIQLIAPQIPAAITVGQADLLFLGITILAVILTSILCIGLSEWFGSSVAVLAVVGGGALLSLLIDFPKEQRVLSQIHDLSPLILTSLYNFFDYKTISIFGLRLTDLQFGYILYPLLTVIILFLGWWKYCRCHAGSR
ncbi:MAG: ABC transporter permease subunit [Lachnospiraceae bacterium]|nr:ABC transporter permease subunit [Lachnospiraceae bacterium]